MASLFRTPLVVACAMGISVSLCEAQELIAPVDRAQEIRRSLGSGELSPVADVTLTLCEADRTPAASLTRGALGLWAGQFRVEVKGRGEWKLRAETDQGAASEAALGGDAPGTPTELLVGPLPATRVVLTLIGPATAQAQCPLIRLVAELRQAQLGKPRGIVGPDDRWDEDSPPLNAAVDSKNLKLWASSIAHIDVLTDGILAPCTGFFISAHVMMTASHCIGTRDEVRRARVRIGTREVLATELRLVMSQKIDFALIWVEGPAQTNILKLADGSESSMIVWQAPTIAKKVSADGCSFDGFDGERFKHRCDTLGGASGAPVQIRSNGLVAGVHILGCTDSGSTQCTNFALRSKDIIAKILRLEVALVAADSVAAAEILAAIR